MKAQVAAQEMPCSLIGELEKARAFLLSILPGEKLWAQQPSLAYSPVGWHLGHIAAMQERWLLPGEAPRYGDFFDPAATVKPARVQPPPPRELRAYLASTLARVRDGLRAGRVPGLLGFPESFLVQHIAQHELQHAEHVQVVSALCEGRLHRLSPKAKTRSAKRLELAGGRVRVGFADAARANDNERPQHEIELQPYWLDRAPVTAGEFASFIEASGYHDRKLWTDEGWDWVRRGAVRAPPGFDEQSPEGPVTCVSWFEADAYARFREARLPTEHEFEAARLAPSGVWEWTASWFAPYPDFRPYPYDGYSKAWFHTHRVLRGGSWATSPALLRPSLRNWYEPGFREIPSGFRCAGGL